MIREHVPHHWGLGAEGVDLFGWAFRGLVADLSPPAGDYNTGGAQVAVEIALTLFKIT